ncbi:MAG: RNA polymerase sigma factor [Eubacterium sp.]|nr:RNA polymerase sigma factor [Eubacterium sp.]
MRGIIGTDEQLYSRFLKDREEEALKILLERYRESLTLFLYGYVHSMEDAEDLMLDAFAEAAARESWSAEGSSFKTWLFAVGRKKALMHLRKQRFFRREEADPVSHDLPEDSLLKEERDRQLYQAMERLKPEYRQVLVLIYFEQMSHEEAARVMKKTKKQIYHLVNRGRDRLKVILTEMGFDNAQY